MMAPRGPGLFPAVILTAAILILIVAHSLSTQGGTARATGGGMDAMSIDMDPSGNTATSIGPREFCARIDRNGDMDADEDAVDGLVIDVTTGTEGIPAGNPMIAFTFALSYTPGIVDIVAEDVGFLLASAPGSDLWPFHLSDALPDSDGRFTSTAIDGTTTAADETGPGVLSRITLTAAPDASPGIYDLVLSDGVHINRQNEGALAASYNHAVVAIGVACPDVQPTPGPHVTKTPGSPWATTPWRTSPYTIGPTTPHGPPATGPTFTPPFTPPPPRTPSATPTPVPYQVTVEDVRVKPGQDFTLKISAHFGGPIAWYSMTLYWDRSLITYRGCSAAGGVCLDANAPAGQVAITGSPPGGLAGAVDLAEISFRAGTEEDVALVYLGAVELRAPGGADVFPAVASQAYVFVGDPPTDADLPAPRVLPAAFPPTGGDAVPGGGPSPSAVALSLLAFVAAIMTVGVWIRWSELGKGRGS